MNSNEIQENDLEESFSYFISHIPKSSFLDEEGKKDDFLTISLNSTSSSINSFSENILTSEEVLDITTIITTLNDSVFLDIQTDTETTDDSEKVYKELASILSQTSSLKSIKSTRTYANKYNRKNTVKGNTRSSMPKKFSMLGNIIFDATRSINKI